MAISSPNPLITGGVMRTVVQSVTQGQQCQFTLDWMKNGGVMSVTSADIALLMTNLDLAIRATLLGCWSPLTTYVGMYGSCLSDASVGSQQLLAAPGVIGTAGATSLNLMLTAVVHKQSAVKGKHGSGRFSIPAIPNTFSTPATDANVINGTGVAAYNLLLSALNFSPLVGGGVTCSQCITTRPVPPATVVSRASTVLALPSGMILRPIMGSARRRKEGRGI